MNWQKLKGGFLHSVTILWARIVALSGVLLVVVNNIVADPNVSAAIQGFLNPHYIPYYIIAIGVVTELARRRTVRRHDDA